MIGYRLRRGVVGLAAVTALLVSVSSLPAMAEVTDANVVEKIAAAKTSADHLEIAAYYRGLADANAEKVKVHERMRASLTSAGSKSSTAWVGHCGSLISAYKGVEKQALEMAREQEKLAKDGDK